MFRAFFLSKEWAVWAWGGTVLILLTLYGQVQVSVFFNGWVGDFYNLFQKALQHPHTVSEKEIYSQLLVFVKVAGLSMVVSVLLDFFSSHWIFRWRTALTDYYLGHWESLRHIEGASQRIQEDTMRFSKIMEMLFQKFVRSFLSLIAFLPLLAELSDKVTSLPLVPVAPKYVLVYVAIAWAIFGTGLMLLVGIRLPGLEFRNQLVEAAFRKELVYGEDDASRADMNLCQTLYGNVRKNYFTIYLNYLYFNVAKYSYLQFNAVFAYLILTPTIAGKGLTMGYFQRIMSAFGHVESSFQFLLDSWTTIVDLMSIVKRLAAFEAILDGGCCEPPCKLMAEATDSSDSESPRGL